MDSVPGSVIRRELAQAAALFRSLGDPARLAIVRCLAGGPARVTDLTGQLGRAQRPRRTGKVSRRSARELFSADPAGAGPGRVFPVGAGACYARPSSLRECEGAGVKIGEVAARSGVPAKTIRFWEDQGLLPAPARTSAGYRDYEPGILERLAFIRQAQAAGLMLEQVRRVLDIRDSGESPCEHVAGLIARRLGNVEARMAELARARDQLAALAARAAAQDPAECRGYCSIIGG